jgi:5-methyltetrahydropteroyltriglutamate--homocysteine methyltransferase
LPTSSTEIRHLESLGVDLIQIDEPEVHFRFSQCEGYATEAIDRALAGVEARTAVHMCYGYSKNIAEKRATPVYAQALTSLAASCVDEISLEYEQPNHQPELLEAAGDKAVILGLLNLDTEAPVETIEHIESRARDAIEVIGPDRLRLAPDCGMWFLPREHAFSKIEHLEAAARNLRVAYS